MPWSKKDIEKLQGKVKGIKVSKTNPNAVKLPAKHSEEKTHIEMVLFALKSEGTISDYKTEFIFDNIRKFRFDWAILDLKIAIEYEGIFSEKSRHTTLQGYTEDCEKYNLALLNEWRILRYTAKNYKQIGSDVLSLLKMY